MHGWDVARACGQPRALPDSLADVLLDAARLLVDEAADRPGRFGRQRLVQPWVTPGERLVAFLGRGPG